MKEMRVLKLFITIVSLICNAYVHAQDVFTFEKIDSTGKNKKELYSLTKLFISETWKSTKDVIQLDDSENGIVLIKGSSFKEYRFWGADYIYIYSYTITFRIRDNKFKVNIDKVNCESARLATGRTVTLIQPFEGDNCPETGTFKNPGLPCKNAIIMMNDLKNELTGILKSYSDYLEKESIKDDW